MIGRTNVGGGGSGGSSLSIGITVVGGTSQPSSPEENTIWVNTSDTISAFVISPTEPSSPSEGLVWLRADYSGDCEVEIITGQAIARIGTVCQYLSGAWVGKDAEYYDGSAWSTVLTWLYNLGDEFLDTTNGLKVVNRSGGAGVKNAENIYLSYSGSSNRDSNAYTVDPIDVTNYSQIHFRFQVTVNNSTWHLGLCNNNTATTFTASDMAVYELISSTTDERNISIDISNVTGSWYPRVHAGVSRGYIYKIWLT